MPKFGSNEEARQWFLENLGAANEDEAEKKLDEEEIEIRMPTSAAMSEFTSSMEIDTSLVAVESERRPRPQGEGKEQAAIEPADEFAGNYMRRHDGQVWAKFIEGSTGEEIWRTKGMLQDMVEKFARLVERYDKEHREFQRALKEWPPDETKEQPK